MAVDRCICHRVSFADLHSIARRENAGFDELVRRTQCTRGCGLCEPYVRLMLETGRTSFAVLSVAEVERIMRRAADQPHHDIAEGESGA